MQLTTPEEKKYDSVTPAENWFLYWKSSPSLWKSKLLSFKENIPLMIPLNWGLHGEFKGQVDFGDYKSETDLKRLILLLEELKLKAIFLIPVSPVPFMPNGGIPSYLARHIATDEKNRAQVFLGEDKKIFKMYSFFEPTIYNGFQFFINKFMELVTSQKLDIQVFAMESFVFDDQELNSTINDTSICFQNGFKKYLNQFIEPDSSEKMIESKIQVYKNQYIKLIKNLYLDLISDKCESVFYGKLDIGFIGSGFSDIFQRGMENIISRKTYCTQYFICLTQSVTPSSLLIKQADIQEVIWNNLTQYISYPAFFENTKIKKKAVLSTIFEFINLNDKIPLDTNYIKELGLQDVINKNSPWAYRILSYLPKLDWEKVYYFRGESLSKENFHSILKVFMQGHKVIIDRENLAEKHEMLKEAFIAENNIQRELVNFHINIERLTLGEGQLLFLNSNEIKRLDSKESFWDSIFQTFQFKKIDVLCPPEVEYISIDQFNDQNDFNFKSVKRLLFFNPTSYRKVITITPSKGHALIKSVNPFAVNLISENREIKLEMGVNGNICLDFGIFNEE